MRGAFIAAIIAAGLAAWPAAAQVPSGIPSWVHPGTVIIYDGQSRYVGANPQPVTVVETIRVTAVQGRTVSGTATLRIPGDPRPRVLRWSCVEGGGCSADGQKFWVDVQHPATSFRGPNGEPLTVLGQGPFTTGGRRWTGIAMAYKNPASGVQYDVTFDAQSGVVLAYSEVLPSHQTYIRLRAVKG